MVSFEFEKPSTWTIGKKVAIVAMIFLIIGGFMSFSICTPILTIALVVFLLYLKYDIYLEKGDETRKKINHIILIIWSGWYLFAHLSYMISLMMIREMFADEGFRIPMSFIIGAGLSSIGFVLLILSGILEWKYPSKEGLGLGIPKKKPKPALEKEAKPISEAVPEGEPEKVPVAPEVRPEPLIEEPMAEPEPAPVVPSAAPQKVEPEVSAPMSEEEKTLLRWARHINRDNETFEQCIKCNNYTFISAKDTGDSILFKCPDCQASFTLKK